MISAETRPAFCFGCRSEQLFEHLIAESWRCGQCGAQRAITVDAVDANKSGDAGRFWASVKKTPFCWPWMRPSKNKHGPRFDLKGKSIKIARAAYFFSRGKWPKEAAFRTCANDFCVRPDHIVDRSQADISRTLLKSGRLKMVKPLMTRCKRGHPFTGDNISRQNGGRFCRLCRNLMNRKHYRKRMAAAKEK